MSDAPQGPGWWLASDGKYYPPQGAAAPAAPPAPIAPPVPAPPYAMPGQPQMGQPQMGQPQMGQPMQMGMPIQPMAPAKKSGGKGCLWAFLIVAVLSILLLVGGVFAANKWFSDTVGGVGCPAVSDADIEAVFENKVNVINTGSALTGVNLTLDDRIMAGEKGCNISVLGTAVAPKPGLGGIFKVEKADATGFFQKELANAKAGTPSANTGAQKPGSPVTIFGDTPLTEPGGAPVTIPNIPSGFAEGPYFLKDVKLGDEAFCTKANIFDASGVLVRKGNTIVYVTVTAGTKNDFDKDYSESNCEYAMKLATKALG